MRNRLIELLTKAKKEYANDVTDLSEIRYVAECLLADGWIRPPCKVGTKVFYVNEVCDENANEYLDISVGEVVSFSIQAEGLWAYCRYNDGLTYWHIVDKDFGKEVFLTREEAEQALQRKEDEGK
jgi:hypothetical protein